VSTTRRRVELSCVAINGPWDKPEWHEKRFTPWHAIWRANWGEKSWHCVWGCVATRVRWKVK